MFIFITVGLLLFTALALLALRVFYPAFRFAWLVAVGGALLAWMSVFTWQTVEAAHIQFSLWRPVALFRQSPTFHGDGVAWAFTLSLVTLYLAIVLTAVVRSNFPTPLSWAGLGVLTSLGVLAVTADNPLTLVLIWAALDVVELIIQLRFVEDPKLSEQIVIAFAARVAGTLMLLWANVESASRNLVFDFHSAPQLVGFYLILAASLRLGVFPLHLPYPSESALRRGFGTGLRMVSAASSLVLLARIQAEGVAFPLAPYLLLFISLAAVYGGWMWLRAPDELTGRPYWMISMASFAVASTLRANPLGAAAWGCALVLCGGVLFITSEPNKWLLRGLWVALFATSALPFSLTASGWQSDTNTFFLAWFPYLLAHGLILAGYIRHIQRAARDPYEDQPIWAKNIYPAGIGVLLLTILLLGLYGWDASLTLGNWVAALTASFLTVSLIRLTPRFRILNPVRAHWVSTSNPSWLDGIYKLLWGIYRQLGRLSNVLSNTLEGEGGIMWTLVFLALFISFFMQGVR